MKASFVKISFLHLVVFLLAGCREKETADLISGQVICRGGCWPNAYYVDMKDEKLEGNPQAVVDYNGVDRGQFTNVVIINNLKVSDQQEGKSIFFQRYKDTEVSCQSSYPRWVREIEISYQKQLPDA